MSGAACTRPLCPLRPSANGGGASGPQVRRHRAAAASLSAQRKTPAAKPGFVVG